MTVSIWPLAWSKRKMPAPASEPTSPPAIITRPMRRSTPPRRIWANTPDTLEPVIWVVAEATATVGGMP